MNTKNAILIYMYSERIKSELIMAFKLLERMLALHGEERRGAEELMKTYFESLLGEVKIAQNLERSKNFLKAEEKINEANGKLMLYEHVEINKSLAEALSAITTSCQSAMVALEEKKLI